MISALDHVLLRSVKFSYYPRDSSACIVGSVTLTIAKGEIIVLYGPNGVGKSTLLRLLSAAITPQYGDITIFGRPPAESRIAMVWQDTYQSLFPWLSAAENAALPLRLNGVRSAARRQRIETLREELGFDVPLDSYPYELSGGQQQQTSILRAFAADYDLLLLDEPTSSLSIDLTFKFLGYLQSLIERCPISVILVTHSPEIGAFVGDKIVSLRHRPLCCSDSDVHVVECPYERPRPLEWLTDHRLREYVRRIGAGSEQTP